jgi:hypothetical protein
MEVLWFRPPTWEDPAHPANYLDAISTLRAAHQATILGGNVSRLIPVSTVGSWQLIVVTGGIEPCSAEIVGRSAMGDGHSSATTARLAVDAADAMWKPDVSS